MSFGKGLARTLVQHCSLYVSDVNCVCTVTLVMELVNVCFHLPLPLSAQYLYNSVLASNFPGILCAIAHGGSVNYVSEEDERKCPILLAVSAMTVSVSVCVCVCVCACVCVCVCMCVCVCACVCVCMCVCMHICWVLCSNQNFELK